MAPPPAEATCRICFSTADESPEFGRLISPCRCRGTAKYVHSECLRQWRTVAADKRNFYECPTCKFQYQMRRLGWGEVVGSTALQLFLTIAIFWSIIFLIGFVADPIINVYDVWSTPLYEYTWGDDPTARISRAPRTAGPPRDPRRRSGIYEHMVKGLSAVGVLGYLKVMFVMGPGGWYNHRDVARIGRRRGGSGADRVSWLVIVIGVATFLYTVYKKVNEYVRAWLEAMQERVLDIGEEDEQTEEARNRAEESRRMAEEMRGGGESGDVGGGDAEPNMAREEELNREEGPKTEGEQIPVQ